MSAQHYKNIFGLVPYLMAPLLPLSILFSLNPIIVGALFLIAALCNFLAFKNSSFRVHTTTILLALVGIFLVTGTEHLALFYPAIMNGMVAALFLISQFSERTIIEKVASIVEGGVPQHAVRYCRRLNLIWGLFMVFNTGVTLWTVYVAIAHGNQMVWAWYNGVISYLLIGILFYLEYVVRQRVKARELLLVAALIWILPNTILAQSSNPQYSSETKEVNTDCSVLNHIERTDLTVFNFRQVRYINGLIRPIESSGEFHYEPEGQALVWRTLKPFASTVRVTKSGIETSIPESSSSAGNAGTLSKSQDYASRQLSNLLLAIHSGDIRTLEKHFDLKCQSSGGGRFRILATPSSSTVRTAIQEISLKGLRFPTEITVIDGRGDRTEIELILKENA